MSPITPPDDQQGFVDALIQWAPIGAAAAVTRALLSEDKESWGWVARRTIASSITAAIIGPAVASQMGNSGVAWACVGAVCYNAAAVWDWVGKKVVSVLKSWFKA